MPKNSASVEVIQDSEDEQPKSSKKKSLSAEPQPEAESGGEAEEGEEAEEEYEIEAILDAKHGAFPAGRMGYLVKWKGYGEEHNSWVDQQDAGNAQDLIDGFWEKKKKNKQSKPRQSKGRARKSMTKDGSPVLDEPSGPTKRKKSTGGRKSKSSQPDEDEGMNEDEEEKPPVKKPKKTPRTNEKSEEMDVDEDTEAIVYNPMGKYKNQKSWESLVARVDTIEKVDGNLKVFFTLNNGDKVVETSQECAKHFPQKLIQFYEANLRWRETE